MTPARPFATRMNAIIRRRGVPHDVVLKDYALSYILAGIAAVPSLAGTLVFKGGTALRKCYFPDYRFSEDLDFTATGRQWTPDEFGEGLGQACREAVRLTSDIGPFTFTSRHITHRDPHPSDQLDFRISVGFPTRATTPIKVEVTQGELIVLPPRTRPLTHQMEDEALDAEVVCYDLREVVLEKLRALLQTRAALGRRTWTNRERDLYDLWYLHRQTALPIEWGNLLEYLPAKARARGVSFDGPDDFRDPRVLVAFSKQWEQGLRRIVGPSLPPFDEAAGELDDILFEVFGQHPD